MNWQAIGQAIAAHLTAYGIGSGVLALAAATSMPKPGTPWNAATLYTWLYETVQASLPINRGARPNTISQPVPPAVEVPHIEPPVEPKP